MWCLSFFISSLKQMDWCFSLSCDLENEAFLYTDSSLHKAFVDTSIGTPIIINFYINEKLIPSRFAMQQILTQNLNFLPYSNSWNIRLSVLNYNIKESAFEIIELIYLLYDQNWRNNLPELVSSWFQCIWWYFLSIINMQIFHCLNFTLNALITVDTFLKEIEG